MSEKYRCVIAVWPTTGSLHEERDLFFCCCIKFNLSFRNALCPRHRQRGGEGSKPGLLEKLSMETRPAIVQQGVPPAPAAQPGLVTARPPLPLSACLVPWTRKHKFPKVAFRGGVSQRKARLKTSGFFHPPVDLWCDVGARDSSIVWNIFCSPWSLPGPSRVSLPHRGADVQTLKMPAEGCSSCGGVAVPTPGHPWEMFAAEVRRDAAF